MFRPRDTPKPKPFKIWNHEKSEDILSRLAPLAEEQWKDHPTKLSKNILDYSERVMWMYDRAKLAHAEKLPVFEYFDSIIPATVPKDTMSVRAWLNLQHTSAFKKHGARVEWSAPLEFDVCIVSDTLM